MNPIYIFGHKKPDTDSVCSAIALSHLKNALGFDTEPRILGDLNSETEFVLDYFDIQPPLYLNDVLLQIRDVEYSKNYFCNQEDSLYTAAALMRDNHLNAIPLVDDKQVLTGILSLGDITDKILNFDYTTLNASFDNILNTIEGEAVLRFEDEIKGEIVAPSYSSTTFINDVSLDENNVLIVGDRHSIIEYAINSKVRLIVLTGGSEAREDHLELARANNVNIIKTKLRTFNVVKIIELANYAVTMKSDRELVSFNKNDYVQDFIRTTKNLKYNVFPVVNNFKECTGAIQIRDISNKSRKKVILVDHNEIEQSVDGVEDAEIIEIVDHHKIGTIGTTLPINFRNMPVGSTATIIYMMYKESNIEIPRDIAGIMLASILSDTLSFKSPTTTIIDKETAMALADVAEVDIEALFYQIYSHSSSLKDKTAEEILFSDLKVFNTNNLKVGVSQITVSNVEELESLAEEIGFLLEKSVAEFGYNIIALFATDIFKNGSYIYFSECSRDNWETIFGVSNLEQGAFLPDIISRKQQIIPQLVHTIE